MSDGESSKETTLDPTYQKLTGLSGAKVIEKQSGDYAGKFGKLTPEQRAKVGEYIEGSKMAPASMSPDEKKEFRHLRNEVVEIMGGEPATQIEAEEAERERKRAEKVGVQHVTKINGNGSGPSSK